MHNIQVYLDAPVSVLLSIILLSVMNSSVINAKWRKNKIENTKKYVWIKPETHKGLKRVTLICLLCPMLVIIHFEKYIPYLERQEEITDQSNFVNNVT